MNHKEEVAVDVTPGGEVVSFAHMVPEERPGASLEEADARSLATSFLVSGMGLRPDSLTFIESHREDRKARRDWTFTFERSGWKAKHGKLPDGRGVGIACGAYMCGARLPIYWNKLPHSGVQLLIDRSGQVTVYCGATEIGQGSDDVLATIVAEVLGIETGLVRCVTGDTALTPVDLGTRIAALRQDQSAHARE